MAREADFGLMIWDGKSPGTVLNVLRLALAGKVAVLFNIPRKAIVNIRTLDNWKAFISHSSRELQTDLKERATPEERRLVVIGDQPSFLSSLDVSVTDSPKSTPTGEPSTLTPEKAPSFDKALTMLNEALAHADATTIMTTLGMIARERGITQVARETGLARESLYRSLDSKGNPEFATVLKVLSSLGLRLEARFSPDSPGGPAPRTGAPLIHRRPPPYT
jgi:probable addiction module antidote protein